MTLENALTLTLNEFRDGLRDSLLPNLEIRAPLALAVAERQCGARLNSSEAWHAGYQLGLLEALQALDEGAELIVQNALKRFSDAQN
jgi:hypothetical protein